MALILVEVELATSESTVRDLATMSPTVTEPLFYIAIV